MKGWRVVKAEGRFDSVGFVARQLMEGHGKGVWKSDCGSCTEMHGHNRIQCSACFGTTHPRENVLIVALV